MPDLATALKDAINRIQTNKEKQMQDQTQYTHQDQQALAKLANDWAADDPAEAQKKPGTFVTTTNVTRETFNTVKQNPGKRQSEIVKLLEGRGFNPQSVATLMVQMTKVGTMRRDDKHLYYVTTDEYTPIKPSALKKAREDAKKIKRKIEREARKAAQPANTTPKRSYIKSGMYTKDKSPEAGIAALGAQAGGVIEVKAQPVITASFDADQLLSTLSFTQAITLYKKLKTMLGEV